MNTKRNLTIKNVKQMKKLLFCSLLGLCMPLFMTAQTCVLVDTMRLYHQDFEGGNLEASITTAREYPRLDWERSTLYSPPSPSHSLLAWTSATSTPAFFYTGDRNNTQENPLDDYIAIGSWWTGDYKYLYLDFTHICKILMLNEAALYIRGIKANGSVSNDFKIYVYDTSYAYKGTSTSISGGDFNENNYSQWGGATSTPNASWWKKERILLSAFSSVLAVLNDPTNVGFQIGFKYVSSGSQSLSRPGWFIDDVSIFASKTELEPPEVTLVAPLHVDKNTTVRNNIGPYLIKSDIKDYDTVNINSMCCSPMPGATHPVDPLHIGDNPPAFCMDSLQFYYTRRGTDSIYNSGNSVYMNETVTANTWITNTVNQHKQNRVNAQWTIPKACYGDTITYTIRAEDIHGNTTEFPTTFIPWAQYAQAASNDVELVSINNMPYAFISEDTYPIVVTFKNKSDNRMKSVDFEYTVDYRRDINGVPVIPQHTGTYKWTGNMCRDWDTTITIGYFTAKRGPDTVCVNIVKRNDLPDNNPINNNSQCYYGYGCDSVFSGDYTVGGINGDFATLEAARLALEKCGVKGHVRMLLHPGTYSAQKFSGYYYGQSDTATVTFMKNPAYTGDVIFVDDKSYNATILLDTTGYLIFKDLVIQGKTSGAYSRGFYITGGPTNDISILNCQINVINGSPAINYAGIVRSSAVTGNVLHGITVDEDFVFSGNTISGGNYGIYYIGSSSKRNKPISIDKNIISSLSEGIFLTYVTGMSSVDSNTVTASNTTANGIMVNNAAVSSLSKNTVSAGTGIALNAASIITSLDSNIINATTGITSSGSGISIGSVSGNNITASTAGITLSSMACSTIDANKISTTGKGISLTSITNSNADIIVSNNEIITDIALATNYGVHLQSSNNLKFINNSIRVTSTQYLNDSRALNVQSGNNVEIKNNILYNTSFSQNQTNYPIYIQTAGTGLQMAYNNYYSTGGKIGFSTIARNNMNEWIYAHPADTNSKAIALSFPYPTSLKTDTCCGLEAPVFTGVTHDLLKLSRGNSTTWMGAYHYSKNADIALMELLSPSVGLNCPSDTMPIAVLLRNTGDAPINFATTPVTLTAKVVTASTTTTYTHILNTGTLAPLAAINDTIKDKVEFPFNDTISISIVATLAGDMCADNDSLKFDNFILKIIQPFYEECFYNVNQCNPITLNPEWTLQQVTGNGNWIVQEGAGAQPTITPVYGTGRLFFNSRSFATNTESRAIMPLIKLGGSTNPVLEFWMAHDNVGATTGNPGNNWEGITIEISTDNGITWTALTPEGQSNIYISRYVNTPNPIWTKHRVNLTSYLGNECVLIGFRAKGKATTGNNINIDKVVLKDRKVNDLAIENVYALGENPVTNLMNQSVKVRVANEGSATQSGVTLTLKVSGANTYTQFTVIPSLAPDAVQTYNINGNILSNPGINTVTAILASGNDADAFGGNDTMVWQMNGNWFPSTLSSGQLDTTYIVSYSDNAPCIRAIGGSTTMKLANRFVPNNAVTIEAIRFYPVNAVNAEGKQVRGFISDGSGSTITTTDIYTLSAADIDSWVELPLNNFTLTGTSQPFYAGIEMIDPGYYIGTQIEAPIRDSAYYTMNGTTYTPSVFGRTMIDARIHKAILADIAILSLVYPDTACDMKHDTVTFTFTQNGMATLAPNTVTFNYAITNHLGVVTTVSELYPGTIDPHQTYQYTFNNLYDFTNNSTTDRTYHIAIWVTNLSGDIVFFNDTLQHTLVSYGKAAKPIVVSPHIGSYYNPAILSATEPGGYLPGDGIFSWYTMVDTNALGDTLWHLEGRGNPFTTFTTFYDTTFYVTFAPGTMEDVTVGTGNTATSSEPLKFTSGYSRGRILYPQSAVGRYGPITEIAIDVIAGGGSNGIPIKIYIKQVPYITFPNTTNNWAAETADATLVYDGDMPFTTAGWHSFPISTFNYTEGSLLILTETNCGGTNCQAVYGSTNYPKIRSSSAAGSVHSVGSNNAPPTGNFSASANRWNMRFQFADLSCQSQKVKLEVKILDRPNYDILTVDTLFSPIPNSFPGYCTKGKDSVIVKIRNMMSETIPANLVVVKAAITGYKVINSANANSTAIVIRPTTTLIDTINTAIAPLDIITHKFSKLYNFSAPETDLQSIRFDIVVSTDLINEVVYSDNDTMRASLFSKQTDSVHNISVEADDYYTLRYTAAPSPILDAGLPTAARHNVFYFYADSTSTTMLNSPGGISYLTPWLFDTVVYWVAARNAITTPTPICTTKRFEFHINVKVPKYDLKTTRLSYPSANDNDLCALNWFALKPKVWVKNTVSDSIIPANTFKLVAKYVSGVTTITGSHVITTPLNPGDSIEVEFATPLNLGSTTTNRVFNYQFFTEPMTPTYVYALNDTVSGTQLVPALPATPPAIIATVPYGQTYTATPSFAPQNMFTFYDVPTGGEPLAQGLSFTTDPVYTNPTVYYYSGQVRDTALMHVYTTGTAAGTNNTPLPFAQYNYTTGANAQVQTKILYTVPESEWLKNAGRIDTIAFQVTTPAAGEMPVKIYIKNAANATALTTASATWDTDLNNATLIYDDATDFVPTYTTPDGKKWFSIPIPGGFNYNGSGIMLFTEQNCDNSIYSNPVAQFRYTTLNNRMVTRSRTQAGTFNNVNFTTNGNRWHTRFVINNVCESGRGTITLNTTVKNKDLEITELIMPITPDLYTSNDILKVKIKNHGTTAASGFKVAYRLADSTATEINASTSNTAAYPIPAGGESIFTYSPIDLHDVYLPTDFYVYIVWADDQLHSNDTLITVLQGPKQCISRATDTARLDISNVTFAGINNGPGTPIFKYKLAPNNGLYTDYSTTVPPAYVVQGQPYPLRITGSFTNSAPGYSSFRAVYIDLNRDNQFEATERVYYSGTTAIPAPTLADSSSAFTLDEITIPSNASLGLTKMRVIAAQTAIQSPCAPYTYGETEDYAVSIVSPFSIDMAISKVLHPDGDICPDQNGVIKLKIKNYGTSTMFFAIYPLQINAQFSGASTQLYTHTISEGALGANQDMVVEIPNIDYSVAGTYNIKTYLTQVIGDNYQINDTSVNVGIVKNTNLANIPYFIDFEPHSDNLELHFDTLTTLPASWSRSYTASSFQWKINMGMHHNDNIAGPEYDHTRGPAKADGRYAVVRSTGTVAAAAVATLTSNCINMHHDNYNYPKIISYYEHIFGATNANIKMYVQVGSGNYYETVDSIIGRTHSSDIQPWINRKSVLVDFDENARIRFVVTGHTGNIDPAIDDLGVTFGQPDLSLERILTPEDTVCLRKGQKINPIVTVSNTGPFPVYNAKILSELRVGAIYQYDTVTITWPHPVHGSAFLPGESIDVIVTDSGFNVPVIGTIVEFLAKVFIEEDSYFFNNLKSVQTCTYTDIEDPDYNNSGIVLGQNIPNPAGSSTIIPYVLPESGKTTISVYSIEGQKLHSVELNGTTGDNSYQFDVAHLADGIYLYALQFKGITLYKKMIIRK
jgi:hypothetical protein